MGKTYSNSKCGDRKVTKSMDELEALINDSRQPPQRFQKRKVNMSINATTPANRSKLVSLGKSTITSEAVATPVRVEPIVSVHVDGVLQHATPPHLPGSGVVVEVKAHLSNAMHELVEMSEALKPVTAIVAVTNPSREIPPAPVLPTVNELKEDKMTTEITQPVLTELEILAIQAYRDKVVVQAAVDASVQETTVSTMKAIADSLEQQADAMRRANLQSGYLPPTQYQPQQHKSRGIFSGIVDKYDDMSTTGKVVTGVVVVAAVAAAGYYGYMAYKDYNVGYNDNIVNNDELV